MSVHHHVAEFRAVAAKAPAAKREYSPQEKSLERNIFNVIVSQLVSRLVLAIAAGGGGSEAVLPSPTADACSLCPLCLCVCWPCSGRSSGVQSELC